MRLLAKSAEHARTVARIDLRDVSTVMRTSEAFLAFPGKKLCVPRLVSAADVSADLARATIASIEVLGALQASPEIKTALSDRIR